jgi:hypothetical protein
MFDAMRSLSNLITLKQRAALTWMQEHQEDDLELGDLKSPTHQE